MATITINIISGTAPFTVRTIPFVEPEYTFFSLGLHMLYDIPAGEYAVQVTDANGCVVTVGGIIFTTTTTTEEPLTTTTSTVEPTTTTTTTEEPITTTTELPVTTTTGEVITTTTAEEPTFRMLFDNILNANTMISGDSSDVADWNTFFDLPANGTPFTSCTVIFNEVLLYGGGNLKLRDYVFGDNVPTDSCLYEVTDNGVVTSCGDGVFSDYNTGPGCYQLTKVLLPSMNIDGTKEVFAECEVLAELDIDFNAVVTLGDDSFYWANLLPQCSFPNLTTAGNYCFYYCAEFVNPSFPSLTSVGNICFRGCTGLTDLNLPLVTTVGFACFYGCTNLSTIDLSSCTDLGGSTDDDNVFFNIIGKTITITIPCALNTDGDISYLDANNTLTIINTDCTTTTTPSP